MSREFDIVLFGATGYTGRLVAEYLSHVKAPLKIALAGRNKQKLESLGFGFPLVMCNALDRDDVSSLAERTRVVCTTVGPYSLYGGPLVAACVDHGTHYCDLTGETPFMKDMIDAHHEHAKQTGARIVHACGFDSIPSDLGVFATYRTAQEHGLKLGRVRARLVRMRGTFSGGTAASLFGVLDRIRDPKVRRAIADTHALDPAGTSGSRDRDQRWLKRTPNGHWTSPFVMAAVNTRVVRRSNGLLGGAYGEGFRYEEFNDHGPGSKGLVAAAKTSSVMLGLVALAAIPGASAVARRFVRQPGEGPTETQRERGSFRFEFDAETDGKRIQTIVAGERDPGYAETSKMLAESAMCLASDPISCEGGVLTPASSMGDQLLARLRRAGMTFSSQLDD